MCGAETGAGVAAEAVEKPKTDPWKLEPQPIREDQVANAVKFLSHPKVRGSPIVHRRSFLERKGLTGEEIDEAFRRVPVPFLLARCRESLAILEVYGSRSLGIIF